MSNVHFWSGQGGVEGDFSYGLLHLFSVLFVVVSCIAVVFIGYKSSRITKRKIVVSLAIIGLAIEVLWRVVYIMRGVDWIELYPFFPCNLAGVIIPIIALTNNKYLKELFYVFAFIGGIITFAIPQGIFVNKYLTFGILKSILQHWAIIVIPVFEYFTRLFKPKFKYVYLTIIGMFIHLINSEFVPKLFKQYGTDYIFLRSGLPFVIPGVPGWLTISIFGILVVIAFYAVLDYKGFRTIFARKK